MSQRNMFLNGEGDAWYSRNASSLEGVDPSSPPPDVLYLLKTLKPFQDEINTVLEIGCSNGIKLQFICEQFGARGYGLDPSATAVADGNQRDEGSDVRLRVGTSEVLPFEAGAMDVVHFAFCLYLIDREVLLKSLAEADRVLKPGGFLAITDFDPGFRYRRPYNHREDVFSYKQDYSKYFTQSGLYYLMGKHSFSHRENCFDADPNERISSSILVKEIEAYPAVF